jgi:hypothetical protein
MRLQRGIVVVLGAWLVAGITPARAETHAALGSRVELNLPLTPHYAGSGGAATLVDGVTGTSYSQECLGFEGPDVEVTVILPVATQVRVLAADFVQVTGPAIFLPSSVDFAVSTNGQNFRTVATLRPQADEKAEGPLLERFQATGLDLTATAVRIRASSGGNVPSWHRSPQALRWTFISEVLVNPGDTPVSAADLLKTYRFGASRWPLTRFEEQLRQSRGEERRQLCTELSTLLGAEDVTTDAKTFCLEQLARCGTAADVEAVTPLLAVPELAAAACRTLAQLGGPAAEDALVTAAGPGPLARRGAALAALAAMHSPRVIESASLLGDDDLQAVAASALAAAGTPAAAALLTTALTSAPEERRPIVAEALLTCADNLLAKDERAAATTAFAALETGGPTPLLRLSGLAGQVAVGPSDRLADVLAAADTTELPLARSALALGAELVVQWGPGPLTTRFATLPPAAQVVAVQAVGRRASQEDVAWLLTQVAAPTTAVRTAAATALASAGGSQAVAALAQLLTAADAAESRAAAAALARLAGADTDAAVLQAATAATGAARPAFCSVLEDRGNRSAAELLLKWGADGDPDLRRAAWKALPALLEPSQLAAVSAAFLALPAAAAGEASKALLATATAEPAPAAAADALAQTLERAPSDTHRAVLLSVLGAVGGPRAGQLLVEHLKHPEADVRAAAARALAEWAEASPAAALLTAAAAEPDERLALLDLRAALGLLQRHGGTLTPEAAEALCTQAAPLAQRDEERQLLLEAVIASPCPAALNIVVKALATAGLVPAAEGALLKLAPALWPNAPLAVQSVLQQLADAALNEETRKQATARLALMPATALLQRLESTAWTPLFDGKSLDGWRIIDGKPDAWVARDGLLVAQAGGGGWLATTQEYADYLVEFEFRLPPDGNSGLFLRPPLEGNPAWEGIEVQLLDDAAAQYANLRPDQYCASIYGIAAASPRVSRPAGTWQRLRVLCLGRRVSVWLNDVNVANGDLDQHLAQAEKIRGITRTSGFPGLQNEHGPIEFRNLRLKNLAAQD